MRLAAIALIIASLASLPAASLAQGGDRGPLIHGKRAYAGIDGGAAFTSSTTVRDEDGSKYDIRLDASFGVHAGVVLTDFLEVEASYSKGSSTAKEDTSGVKKGDRAGPDEPDHDSRHWMFAVPTFVLRLPGFPQAFAKVGGRYWSEKVFSDKCAEEACYSVHAGAGRELGLTRNLSWRTEGTFHNRARAARIS